MNTQYLDSRALNNLRNYKYVSGEWSPLDIKLNPFWNSIVEYIPLWMAPNLVTLLGLCFQILNVAYFLYLDLSMTQQFPPSLYIWSAFSLFVYQTLDAIDGKQARRTGTSSPLGQLFDHGCDALQSCIICYISLQVWKCPPTEPSFYILHLSVLGVFFCANWEEYHVGVLRTSQLVGSLCIGLTECQFIIIFFMLVEAFTIGNLS
jgi:phosphatidylglycerophosphate synthase